jgi:hypothetical protein
MMKQIEFPFTRDGFFHELEKRAGPVCLVKRTRTTTGISHFEAVILQRKPARQFPDCRTIPEHWGYPSTEQWGQYGWTYQCRADALERFIQLARCYLPITASGAFDAELDTTQRESEKFAAIGECNTSTEGERS